VQLAKWKGAYVIGTASARNPGLLRELGADEVIDYTGTRFETAAHGVDVVLDAVGGDTLERSFEVVRPGGTLTSITAHPSQERAAERGIRAALVVVRPEAAQLTELARLVDEGRVRPLVETVLPLADARTAHELSATEHTRGKIVLRVREG
jgi:NADPH:quinone reductase-like Zn-dependent oxidoreductase